MKRRYHYIGVAAVWAACGVTTIAHAAGDVAQGKIVYDRLCASCHGAGGAGDGPAGTALTPKPRNFKDAVAMKALTDDRIKQVTLKGGASVGLSPLMPPWEAALKPGEIDHLLVFIRSLSAGK
ncbi:MAG: cytochrome c [Deltaproteobacteria bacterium]|nr:cytochrome c [Deltaproteobacteria bacterium]